MASVIESKNELIARLGREKNQLYEERLRHLAERDRLKQEVKQIRRQLQTTTDGKKRKQLQDDISLTEAKQELAYLKALKANALYLQRLYEQESTYAESEGEIQHYKKWAEDWEDEVRKIEEAVLEIEKKEHYEDWQENSMEGYTCVGRSGVGFVYIPDTIPHTKVDIQSVSDNTVCPKRSANEVLLTPVVSITLQSQMLSMDKPAVVELMKTAELYAEGDKKIVPMFSNTDDSILPNWEDLHVECEVLDDRFRFKTTHFSYFAVIARFSPPTSSVKVDPETDSVDKLIVPELPGFSVTIPPKSVPSPIEAKATLYYDESDEWKDSANEQLASACVRLEPEGQKFSEKVIVNLPIPGYSEIIAANPGAKLQVMYSPSGSANDWEIHEDMEVIEVEGEFVAQFFTDHFSFWLVKWLENVRRVANAIEHIFKRVTSLRGRCQVFMSSERDVGSDINFLIQVSVYPFQDPPIEIPADYKYILHDSGALAIEFTPGYLYFSIKLEEFLYSKKDKNRRFKKCHRLPEDTAVHAIFNIHLEKESKSQLVEGAVIAELSVKDGLNEHECYLKKACQREISTISPSIGLVTEPRLSLSVSQETATYQASAADSLLGTINEVKKSSNSTSLEHPTSRNLTFIEWRNEQGKKERFRLKEKICHKWHELGCLLEVPLPVLSSWEKKHLKDDLACINEVLCQWLEEPTDYYPDTWEGLYRLLDHANLNQIVEDLKRALTNAL